MFSLHCTQKLLGRMRVEPEPHAPVSGTVLGAWYANLIRRGSQQLILCVSERTRLPVLVPAVDARSLPRRPPEALADVLQALGIAAGSIARELSQMQEAVIARTASRSVLGTMTDFAFLAQARLGKESLTELALWIAQAPCKPIDIEKPSQETKTVFAAALH